LIRGGLNRLRNRLGSGCLRLSRIYGRRALGLATFRTKPGFILELSTTKFTKLHDHTASKYSLLSI
jgi:predicted metallopeptidase